MAADAVPHVPELSFSVSAGPDETTVRCAGRIVAETTQSLKSTVKPLLVRGKTVILDLSEVSYLDSSGLGTIIGLYVSSTSGGSQLKLINLNARLRELFSITRLGEVMSEGRDPEYLGLP